MANEKIDFFEGTEKLLEIWFSSSILKESETSLMTIKRSEWEALLEHVNCKILNEIHNDDITAYLLSESSLFVSKNRCILKTCGNTTLLNALEPLLTLVKEKCSMDTIKDIFYSRKCFRHPELQHKMHQNCDAEVAVLDRYIKNGSLYVLGRLNKDCWYLYTNADEVGVQEPDQTIEVLMTNLNKEVMRLFYQKNSKSAKEVTEKSAIDQLVAGAVIDDYLFEPCGYSMNAILPKAQYFTIHVTPEPEYSYVSFESNTPKASYQSLVSKILKIFQPGHFLLTVFANEDSMSIDSLTHENDCGLFDGYKRHEKQLSSFKNYSLFYSQFSKL